MMEPPITNYQHVLADPTPLTTAQIVREIESLDKRFTLKVNAIEESLKQFRDDITRVPTEVDRRILGLRELQEEKVNVLIEKFSVVYEKFNGIKTQFDERDTRVEQTARDTRVAVDAALQAAKEAVGKQNESSALAIDKSERATKEQISQQGSILTTEVRALNEKIDDIKERVGTMIGTGRGIQASWGVIVTAIAAVLGLIGILNYMK